MKKTEDEGRLLRFGQIGEKFVGKLSEANKATAYHLRVFAGSIHAATVCLRERNRERSSQIDSSKF